MTLTDSSAGSGKLPVFGGIGLITLLFRSSNLQNHPFLGRNKLPSSLLDRSCHIFKTVRAHERSPNGISFGANPILSRFSFIFLKLPTLPVFTGQIFVCFLKVGYSHVFGIVIHFPSRP